MVAAVIAAPCAHEVLEARLLGINAGGMRALFRQSVVAGGGRRPFAVWGGDAESGKRQGKLVRARPIHAGKVGLPANKPFW